MKHRAIFGCLAAAFAVVTAAAYADDRDGDHDRGPSTRTPIKHLVVIFQENVSFDHYFGTYPNAQNLPGEDQIPRLAAHAAEHQHAADAARYRPRLRAARSAST